MDPYQRWIRKRILVTVRTYPVPARKSIEISCTAGIADDGRWIRLFPIPYRFLDQDKRFRKYQYIEANVAKATSDLRSESHNVNIDSIRVLPGSLPSDDKWRARKNAVYPLKAPSLCELQRQRDRNKEPTLGFFKPKAISGLKIERADSKWTEEDLHRLRQYPLFGSAPQTELEKIPYTFSYAFQCDDPSCNTHLLSCTDWEMGAAYRAWVGKYGRGWEEQFRKRFETEMILTKDTHFFVGTMRTHPDAWIIVGLFYPPM